MKLILKLLAWPFALALSILISVCAFLLSRAAFLFGLASTILSTLALLVLLAGSARNAGILVGVAFLISPFGLPILAARLLGCLAGINETIKSFIHG